MSENTPIPPPYEPYEEAAAPRVVGGRSQGVYAPPSPGADAEHGSYGAGHAAAGVEQTASRGLSRSARPRAKSKGEKAPEQRVTI